jgi:uncharacterized protein
LTHTFRFAGAELVADPSGALFWPEAGVLAVADLHLEKGSAAAARGRLLPPYDTRATLDALEAAVARLAPARVICLGDSFHDGGAGERMAGDDARRVRSLAGDLDWLWIAGNHDPDPPAGLGGRIAAETREGPLVFRHAAKRGAIGEVSGHLHPVASIPTGARRVRGRCFVHDGAKLILPAFGAFTGGLDVGDEAVRGLLGPRFDIHLIARGAVYRFPGQRAAH